MKRNIILFVSMFFLVGLSALIIAQNNYAGAINSEDDEVVCTMDAKMCPDGSYVGRIGPNCEFAPCSGEDDEDELEEDETDYDDEEQVVGSSCGTVTPSYNNECCVNKGYEGWDAEEFKCIGEITRERNGNMIGSPRLLGAEGEHENEDECEEWNCTKWSACLNGNQTRQCIKIAECSDEEEEEEQVVGDSCGTVTPGYNNECCVNKGYEGWDAEEFKCIGEKNETEDETPRLIKSCYERERIRQTNHSFECPEECVCSGSTVKCSFENGTRVMTVYAGNSGNVIVQIKNLNMSTNVTLYKSDGKIYGVFRGNKTHEIMLPDEIKERLQNNTHRKLYNESVNLNEDGYYHIQGHKKSRLFWLVPVREHMTAEVDSETGQTVKIRNPWWGFLARDVREDNNDEESEN